MAWCALECLVERSGDGRTAVASVRAVAAELGVAKNTAHRAITSLARAGLVKPLQARKLDGRFQPGSYLLDLGDLLTTAPTPPTPSPRQRATTSARQRATTPAAFEQLTLLPSA